eukprot:1434321-Amphidinium_carterae.1
MLCLLVAVCLVGVSIAFSAAHGLPQRETLWTSLSAWAMANFDVLAAIASLLQERGHNVATEERKS